MIEQDEQQQSTESQQQFPESQQQHPSLISRIGNWFKRGGGHDAGTEHGGTPEFIVNNENGDPNDLGGSSDASLSGPVVEPRSTFLRPWAKRDAAIENLQHGLSAVGDLMSGIREHMEKQAKRQDELLGYLSHLPAALESLPESNRAHAEALKAIHESMNRQGVQQSKLGEILERITQADGQTGRTLDALSDHVEQLRRHDEAVAQNLNQVGDAMENLGKNTAASAAVLEQMRDNTASRDGEIERILQQQGNRFTTLLAVAMFLSISALIAAGVIGYLGLQALQQAR